MDNLYLGIDVGSVSANLVLLHAAGEVLDSVYLRTGGRPLWAVQEGLARLRAKAGHGRIAGVAATGSARYLVGLVVGADLIKNEITAHTVAALHVQPDVQTVIEIGGQDSKIIIIRRGVAVDFAMNTVCAAGTGSFLDQQAARRNLDIKEFGALALQAENPVAIAGRCAVFAESDMIHKQQIGHPLADIAAGLCEALVRNYLTRPLPGRCGGQSRHAQGLCEGARLRAHRARALRRHGSPGRRLVGQEEHGRGTGPEFLRRLAPLRGRTGHHGRDLRRLRQSLRDRGRQARGEHLGLYRGQVRQVVGKRSPGQRTQTKPLG